MSDLPFFRGQNNLDWLFAVTLQSAVDWDTSAVVAQVADQFGYQSLFSFGEAGTTIPPVTVVVTTDYVFVVSTSTKNSYQWIGNLLGSVAVPFANVTGAVAAYFATVAGTQFSMIRNAVQEVLLNKKLVLIGFSLGGASVTILKELFSNIVGIPSACIAFGCPRVGLNSFTSAYPTDNFARLIALNDIVGSVPPIPWAGLGVYDYWTPFPPFVAYDHIAEGYSLSLPNNVGPGDYLAPVEEVITSIADGTSMQWHNQSLYSRILRGSLPGTLEDGYQGYPKASKIDDIAKTVFSYSAVPWQWPVPVIEPSKMEVSTMGIQMALYFQDVKAKLGFQETYYFSGNDPAVPFALFSGGASSPGLARRIAFLSSSCECYAVRCSKVGGPRQSYLAKFTPTAVGTVSTATDKIEAAISYFGYDTAHLQKRQFHFRGVSSVWIAQDVLTPTGVANLPLVETWLSYLQAINLCFFSQKSPTTYPLQAASSAQNGLITVTMGGSPPGIPANTLVTIRGCKAAPLLNGIWQAVGTQTSPAAVTLSGTQRYSAPAIINGNLSINATTFNSIQSFAFNGVSKRDTGRPSFLQRGRQSAQLRHR